MTLAELNTLLNNITGFNGKVVYYAWPKGEPQSPPPPLPFICYWQTGTDNMEADGIVYHKVKQISIELYSKYKDTASEEAIEKALTDAEITYEATCEYIDSEKCFMTTYEIEV